jgi:predicted RND superfamily exporter protein
MPCLITWANTAVGFYSLFFQDIPPFQMLGIYAGTGTMYAFLASVFTLPALLSLIPFKTRQTKSGTALNPNNPEFRRKALPQWPIALVDWVDQYKKPIVWLSIFTTLSSIGLIFTIKVDSNAVKFFNKKTEFRQATEFIDAGIIGTNPYEYGFDAGEPGGVYDPKFLKKIERFQQRLLANPEYKFTHVSSIVDVVKRINQTMHGGDPAFYSIPDKDSITAEGDTLLARNLIAQYVLLYSLSLPQGMELTNQVNIDNSMARATAFQQTMTSSQQGKTAKGINEWLDQEMPELKARTLGVPIMFGNMMNMAMPGMLMGMGSSMLIITLFLVITFRSFKAGLLSLIPNIWPIIIMYGLIGITGYMVNLSVALVGMITLGIAVDDTVHFMLHYLDGLKSGKTRKESLVHSFQECGVAIIFTSIILIAGFMALTLSDFAVNVDLGMFCSLVWALALLAEFTVLPAVILVFDKQKPK